MHVDRRWAAAPLVLLGALCACDSVADEDDLAALLDGRRFVSGSVEGRELATGTEIRISFEDDRLSGYAGCNHLDGQYRIAGNVLHVQGLSTTQIGCEPALHAQDQWLTELLTDEPLLDLDEEELSIAGDGVTLLLIDREVASPDRPLVGTHWIGNGMGDDTSIGIGPDSMLVTADFGQDGAFEVFTSCVQGTGTFTADDATIEFDEIAYTDEVCSPASRVPLSSFVMSVFDGQPVTYEIEEASLEIRNAGRVLLFRADE